MIAESSPNGSSSKLHMWLLFALVALPLIGIAAFVWWLLYTGEPLCNNRIVCESVSPNKELKAIVFVRDCGATTSESLQLTILKAEEKLPNVAGNTFIEDTGHNENVRFELAPVWISDRKLVVMRDRKARVFKENKQVAPWFGMTVYVTYSDFPPSNIPEPYATPPGIRPHGKP